MLISWLIPLPFIPVFGVHPIRVVFTHYVAQNATNKVSVPFLIVPNRQTNRHEVFDDVCGRMPDVCVCLGISFRRILYVWR